ncbi:membrane GTPase [Pavlovales sp. CCMP2436]|nr:membrane GTPase [Pavlovales sp. CCMP2436]|mmetsp:Transcript_29074/g.68150  ORF Transcript_29074/g.68150 Transcript_29074/m.68150 type:complete len:656 (+) Transcript_29074:3-1970(+)
MARVSALARLGALAAPARWGLGRALSSAVAFEATGTRNVAIVAHVDHGKTTLVDRLLRNCEHLGSGADGLDERAMDSNAQERERGITIMSKVTSIIWRGVRVNIVDTPGHADFGAEVERVLGMVDSVVLLVDATEGVMAQTKFVLRKAIGRGLRPLVVLNKSDRDSARHDEVTNEIFDVMVSMGANDEQLDFPIMYASGKQGWALDTGPDDPAWAARESAGMAPLLDRLLAHCPPPAADYTSPFAMVVTMMAHDAFVGRLLTGRVVQGTLRVNDSLVALAADGSQVEAARATALFIAQALQRVATPVVQAGDIVTVAGLGLATVGQTVCAPELGKPLLAPQIDPPTVSMTILPNSGPLSGKDPKGKHLTSQKIKSRIYAEALSNVSVSHKPCKTDSDGIDVYGRGAMQLGVLVENMRREGFEVCISPPRVVTMEDPDGSGKRLEPFEDVWIEVDDDHSGGVIDKLTARKGEIQSINSALGRTMISIVAPARSMFGFRSGFFSDTRGTGVLTTSFREWRPWAGLVTAQRKGALISTASGTTSSYALAGIEPRGVLFIGTGEEVYTGQILGEANTENDIEVNPCKRKELTNFRTTASEEMVRLVPPKTFALEELIAYVESDELLEVTPTLVRLRKVELDSKKRTSSAKKKDKGGPYW